MFLSAKLSPFKRRFLEAAIAFDRAIKEDPTLFEPDQSSTVDCYLKAETLRRPLRCLKRRKPARPDDFESRVLWAQALTELGRRDEARRANEGAVESIEKHLELNPDEARAYSLGASVSNQTWDKPTVRSNGLSRR